MMWNGWNMLTSLIFLVGQVVVWAVCVSHQSHKQAGVIREWMVECLALVVAVTINVSWGLVCDALPQPVWWYHAEQEGEAMFCNSPTK